MGAGSQYGDTSTIQFCIVWARFYWDITAVLARALTLSEEIKNAECVYGGIWKVWKEHRKAYL